MFGALGVRFIRPGDPWLRKRNDPTRTGGKIA
jgi:hypothetical protein